MKENKIEKLILDLSNRWECTPQEAVDRLNSMNESEINKLIESMVKKFQGGGQTDYNVQFFEHTFPNGGKFVINKFGNGEVDEYFQTGSGRDQKSVKRLVTRKPIYSKMPLLSPLDSVLTIRRPGGVSLEITSPHSSKSIVSPELWKSLNDQMDAHKTEALSFKNGGIIDCLRAGGNLPECKKCGGKAPIKAVGGPIPSKGCANKFEDLKKNQNSSTSDTTKKKEIVRIPGLHKQLGPIIPPLPKPNKKK